MTTKEDHSPQIKICGLTRIEHALGCATLGADAVGCVFYPPSPRYVSDELAREICRAVSRHVKTVGVFANETFARIMQCVEYCQLDAVQLHGQESPELVARLYQENIIVIKALFVDGNPSPEKVSEYQASAYLVECGKGILPGGNALVWNWETAQSFGQTHAMILAGGLAPDNVCQAIAAGQPDAVDVSSGVESAPGQKDLVKVEAFVSAVRACAYQTKNHSETLRKIF